MPAPAKQVASSNVLKKTITSLVVGSDASLGSSLQVMDVGVVVTTSHGVYPTWTALSVAVFENTYPLMVSRVPPYIEPLEGENEVMVPTVVIETAVVSK